MQLILLPTLSYIQEALLAWCKHVWSSIIHQHDFGKKEMDWPVLGELESLPEASSRPDVSKILHELRLVVDPNIY